MNRDRGSNPLVEGHVATLMGFRIILVEPGTTVTDKRTGESAVVSECNTVLSRNKLYCTEGVYRLLSKEFADTMNYSV